MKIHILSLFIILVATVAYAQTPKEIYIAYEDGKYGEVLQDAQKLMAKEPSNPFPYGVIGSVYSREANYDLALPYLRKCLELDNDSTFISAWSHLNLGKAYVDLGSKEKGMAELHRCVELSPWGNTSKEAKHILDSLGYPLHEKSYPKDYLPNWVRIEGAEITYKFQDTTNIGNHVYKTVQEHERAYAELKPFFEANLPTRITIYLWSDEKVAKKILGMKLCFTYFEQCFCHEDIGHDHPGHKIAHVLAYWSWGEKNKFMSKLISEGIAVYYDGKVCNICEVYNSLAEARKMATRYKIKGIMKVWENEKHYVDDVLYPMAGAFVAYLQQHSTPEQFKQLIKQQTIEHAKIIYGDKFATLIADFDNLVGMYAHN